MDLKFKMFHEANAKLVDGFSRSVSDVRQLGLLCYACF